jgi:hypothetical protein
VYAQIRATTALAVQREQETKIKRGQMVPLIAVEWEREAGDKQIRDGLLNLSARIGPEFEALGVSAHDAHRIIDAGVREVLRGVADAVEHQAAPTEIEVADEADPDA